MKIIRWLMMFMLLSWLPITVHSDPMIAWPQEEEAYQVHKRTPQWIEMPKSQSVAPPPAPHGRQLSTSPIMTAPVYEGTLYERPYLGRAGSFYYPYSGYPNYYPYGVYVPHNYRGWRPWDRMPFLEKNGLDWGNWNMPSFDMPSMNFPSFGW